MDLPEMPSGMTCITNLTQEWDTENHIYQIAEYGCVLHVGKAT